MFLNRFLSMSAVASRRKSVDEIKGGFVKVNGVIVLDPAYKVSDKDVVTYKGKKVEPKNYVYILLNKPERYISAVSDGHGMPHVMELIKLRNKAGLYPVGRLDMNSTGVLVITNDGDFAQQLAHPKYEVSKVYEAVLDQDFDPEHFKKLLKGIHLKDGMTKVDRVFYAKKTSRKKISVELHSGKNRIVRRLFKALGYNVIKLDRYKYAGLSKRGLSRGEWRYLTQKEIDSLKK